MAAGQQDCRSRENKSHCWLLGRIFELLSSASSMQNKSNVSKQEQREQLSQCIDVCAKCTSCSVHEWCACHAQSLRLPKSLCLPPATKPTAKPPKPTSQPQQTTERTRANDQGVQVCVQDVLGLLLLLFECLLVRLLAGLFCLSALFALPRLCLLALLGLHEIWPSAKLQPRRRFA